MHFIPSLLAARPLALLSHNNRLSVETLSRTVEVNVIGRSYEAVISVILIYWHGHVLPAESTSFIALVLRHVKGYKFMFV